jgi:hypothetical protein
VPREVSSKSRRRFKYIGLMKALHASIQRAILTTRVKRAVGRFYCAVAVLLGLTAPTLARGHHTLQPVPANGQCSVRGDPQWKAQEMFVWQHVCVGEPADFNTPNYGGNLDPKRREGLPESRIIRPEFLQTILLEDKYRKVPRRRGVRIAGARLTDTLNLENIQLEDEFELVSSLLEKGVNLSGLRSKYAVVLAGSNITGQFLMNGGHLDGQLALTGSKITGPLLLEELQIGGSLVMLGAQFGAVRLLNVHVGGQLGLGGAMVTGPLDLQELQIGDSLLMDRDAQFGAVRLINVHVGGQLNLFGSNVNNRMLLIPKFYGQVTIQGVQVSSTVHLSRGAEFNGPIEFIFSKVGQNVELAGGVFRQNVTITGTQIDGELRLGRSDPDLGLALIWLASWSPNSILTLRNTSVGAIQDYLRTSWPNKLDLNGFTYHNLGGLSEPDDPDPMINRPAEWFEGWLRKQASYSPAPYQQLASVLREQGKPDTADEVLYDGKQRERAQSSPLRYIGLTLYKGFIGYGYYLFWSGYWALGLLAAGTLMLWLSREGWRVSCHYNFIYGIVYSFDMLLPLIRLRERHYQIDLTGWVRYYFYIHKIMGYVIASFLIAGIAWLTTK